jgi:Predicted membrane protein (DUF2207)
MTGAIAGVTASDFTANFTAGAVALLVASAVAAVVLAVVFVVRWTATFPDLPAPGPETPELGPERPAIANLLANRCRVTTAAAAATLIDLAARRHLELFEIGPGHYGVRVRVRHEEIAGREESGVDALTDYEEQVLRLVQQKATGGSAPLEAIQLDEATAGSWRTRFADAVVADAKEQGLLRNRWTRADFLVIGGLAAVVLALLAGALFVAHVEQRPDHKGGDQFDRQTWVFVALALWLGVLVALRRLRSIRYSAAGEAVAARWLGVKRYLQHDESFGDLPPAGVAIWDRLLAYGAALGVARGAADAIPLQEEEADVAWSRVGGQWHQVHVEYPTRFGYGQPPGGVLLNGVLRTVGWGAIAFVALPVVANVAWSAGTDAIGRAGKGEWVFAAAFAVVFGALAVYLVIRVADGLIRAFRGLADLKARVTVTGQVVKHHSSEQASWFAVDPGEVDAVQAVHPGDDGRTPSRGATVEMVLTPHLHHVVSVTQLEP